MPSAAWIVAKKSGTVTGSCTIFFESLVRFAVSASVLEPAAGEHAGKTRCPDARVRRRCRIRGGRPNSVVMTISVLSSRLRFFQVDDQRRHRRVEFLDQFVLLQNAGIVHVPASAVQKVEVVRDFDEPHASLDQSPRKQAALAELAAVAVHAVRWLLPRV